MNKKEGSTKRDNKGGRHSLPGEGGRKKLSDKVRELRRARIRRFFITKGDMCEREPEFKQVALLLLLGE